ncbi:MAG: ThuA domain-containing protein [Planctomycetota bacterium]
MILRFLWAIAALTLATSAVGQEPIRTLIVTGANNHDWEFTSAHYESFLEATGSFVVDITREPAATLANAEKLSSYDVLLLDYNGPRWGEPAEQNFVAAIRAGKGLVVTHASNNAFDGWQQYEEMVGLCWRDGAGHGAVHEFDVEVVDYNHPICAGLPPRIRHRDELYHGLRRTPAARLRVLLRAHSSQASGGSGKDEPMALILEYGQGRIFHTTLGHVWPGQADTRSSVTNAAFQDLVARGATWAAHRPLPPARAAAAPEDPEADAVTASQTPQRPRQPWVFRCVLDERPRVVVCALATQLWVAYDMADCSIYRVWGGDVKLDGAVYTGAHGPQPTSRGLPYFVADTSVAWQWTRDELAQGDAPLRYRGYRLQDGKVRFQYLGHSALSNVVVFETPEYSGQSGLTLTRTFDVTGLPAGVNLHLPAVSSPLLARCTVNGNFHKGGPIALSKGRTIIEQHYLRAGGVK